MKRSHNPFLTLLTALVLVAFTAGPVFLSLVGSVIPDRVLLSPDRSLLDEGLTLDNYRYVFTGELPAAYQRADANRAMISDAARQVPGALWNSTQIALLSAALNLLLGTPAAFVFARYRFPLKKPIFLFLILSPLVPSIALVTPIYMTIEALGLLGTKAGIALIHTTRALPFTVFILTVFFRRLPTELLEAGILDGCSRLQLLLKIVVPLALPSIAATGLFAFMLSYAEFMFSMILSGQAHSRTISVVTAALARNTDVSWGLLNTAIFIALVPTLALVALVWHFVVENMLGGAAKG